MTTTRKVDYAEYATRIVRATPEGVLLTTQAHGTLDEDEEARRRTRGVDGICGTHRGDECDKFAMASLTPVPSEAVGVPGVLELPLTLERQVACKQALDVSLLPEEMRARFYPADVDGSACGSNRDPHLMVFGRVVGAYVAEA
ncbi:MAG: hypothetical protein SOH58_05545 [Olsenella sp.]|jgi:hypothetical protein